MSRQLVTLLREEPRLLGWLLNSREVAALSTLAPPSIAKAIRRIGRILVESGPDGVSSHGSRTEAPIYPLDGWSIRRLESKIRARIDKARHLLDYRPSFTFETGIRLTGQWARWANLIDG